MKRIVLGLLAVSLVGAPAAHAQWIPAPAVRLPPLIVAPPIRALPLGPHLVAPAGRGLTVSPYIGAPPIRALPLAPHYVAPAFRVRPPSPAPSGDSYDWGCTDTGRDANGRPLDRCPD
jgi:hypothetical protein